MDATRRRVIVACTVALLFVALVLQLTLAARRNSATFDEPAHIYAGYLQWTKGYYTLNPPLTRYLMAAPLIGMPLQEPPIRPVPIRVHEILGGRAFVFENDADDVLFRARMAIVLLTLALAGLVFTATRTMFGAGAGVVALAMLAFDPTLLAHSSVATTDTGQAVFMFWAVYAFYRYVKEPTAWRMGVVALGVGLAFAAKTSAVVLLPTLALLALVELVWGARLGPTADTDPAGRRALRFAATLVVAAVASMAILWAFYGFRYVPADGGVPLVPPMAQKLAAVPSAWQASVLGVIDRLHLLPQAYTYGFAHFLWEAKAFTTYLLGTIYPHAVWFFFPVAMTIKSTLTFLVFLALAVWAVATGRVGHRREVLHLAIPAAVYMAFAMAGGMNIGIRHVLPVYVFLAALTGGVASALVQRNRRWLPVVVVLLVFQAVSVVRVFPAYIAYANELWGGPSHVHKHLSDSSTDWGQQVKAVKRYLEARGIRDCWFSYFGEGPIDVSYYGLPCKPLVSALSLALGPPYDVPPTVDGPVLISACTLSGFEFGPPPLHPYEPLAQQAPVDIIDYGVMVFEGRFDIPLAAALSHVQKAGLRLRADDPQGALAEARAAEVLAPNSASVNAIVGQALEATDDADQAAEYYRKALALAERTHPEFQAGTIADLKRRLGRAQR